VVKGVSGWVESYGGCLVLWPACVWVYFCCFSGWWDFRGLGLCAVGKGGLSPHGKCVAGRDSVVTGWGRMGDKGKDRKE
jgi:hypothetical protein